MINDSISDLFTRIRNANLVKKDTVVVPFNKVNKSIVEILAQHGFISNYNFYLKKKNKSFFNLTLKFENKKPVIFKLQRISKPGCRIYTNSRNIPKTCGKIGVTILSTSKGIISDREAIKLNVGGELIGFIL
uniref:Small ribosomal subunit protein uS8c n=1 Tax=Boodleopsis sp. H.0758 TaxID=2320802 RepID=A0A386AZR8_9CHLO|nr:ribosomal protein S8 [Boodleopsis sp. H.0758]AYC64940.1 ribosomal protein S8 [Boodleopsis sp. H.0758]